MFEMDKNGFLASQREVDAPAQGPELTHSTRGTWRTTSITAMNNVERFGSVVEALQRVFDRILGDANPHCIACSAV